MSTGTGGATPTPGSGGSSGGVAGTGEAGGSSGGSGDTGGGPGIAGSGVAGDGSGAGGMGGTSGSVGSGGRGGTTSGVAGRGGTSGVAGRGGTSGAAGRGGTTGSGGTSPGLGCTPPTAYPNLFVTLSGHTQAESDAKVAAAWTKLFTPGGSGSLYFNGPGSDESYVKDTYNNDVRTEGMGYGLVIAVQLDHQTEFDRLWTWVRNHMASGCSASGCTGKQIAWHCSTSGGVLSSGGAPDGDEYFAAALIFAAKRWGNTSGKYNYATEAQWVLNLVRTSDFNSTYHLVKFYSGSDNGQTDASYVLPAFYQTWACFDTANAAFWNSAVTASRAYFKAGADANGGFGDQSAYDGSKQVSTGVDKIRVVANIMMDWNFFAADPWQHDTYAPAFAAREKNAGANAQGFCDSLLAFGLPASTGKTFSDKLWSAGIPTSYWDGTLYMLALLHVSGTFKLWY
jgi:oligosaccharide reducing-end xylanase